MHPLLVLNAAPNGLDQVRIGLIVSRKVARKAVQRNKVKRRLREILRSWIPHLHPGWDIIVVARPPAREATFHELRRVLWDLVTQADLWQNEPPPLEKPQAP